MHYFKIAKTTLALLTALVLFAPAAEAQVTTLPLPAPPTGTNQASSAIFDAMLAIARNVINNAPATQAATFTYNQAVQQYQAGDLTRSRSTALQAISQANAPVLPHPIAPPPTIPVPKVAPMPLIHQPAQADAEEFVALVRGALSSCGPAGSMTYQTALQTYNAVQHDYAASNYAKVRTEGKTAIDSCAAVLAQTNKAKANAPSAPLPTVAMPPTVPDSIVTPGPDPALQPGAH